MLQLLLKSADYRTRVLSLALRQLDLEWPKTLASKFAIWYSVAFKLNPAKSVKWLEAKSEEKLFYERLLSIAATWRDVKILVNDGCRSGADQCELLGRIYLLFCKTLPRDADETHEGPFTPSPRDEATTVRDDLLGRIAEEGGVPSYNWLYRLGTRADVPASEMRWIHHLAFSVAERHARRPAWSVDTFLEYSRLKSMPVVDEQSLWTVVRQDVDEAIRNLMEGMFSIRTMLATCAEPDMQLWLARELELLSKGRYRVWREPEQADKTTPDIVAEVKLPYQQHCAITLELKVADKRTVDSLISDLTQQLHNDYLKSRDTNHGIFVVMWKAEKTLTYKGKGRRGFKEVKALLEREADRLSRASGNTKHVEVRCFVCPKAASPRNVALAEQRAARKARKLAVA